MRKLLFCLIAVFTLLSSDTYAYNKYTTTRITSQDGLSQNDVLDIIQDSYGFMWVATNDGLCRYDGYEFKIFSIGDLGLSTNLIISIVEDSIGNIWVGTADKGVYCYLRDKNHFYHYSELADTPAIVPLRAVRNLTLANDGSIWGYEVLTQTMVHMRFNQSAQRISLIDLYPRGEDGVQVVSSIHATKSAIYVGAYNGLFVYSPKNKNFIKVNSSKPISGIIDIKARGEVVHIATWSGFLTLNTRTGRVKKHDLGVHVNKFHWQGNMLWIASSSGVYTCKYTPSQDKFYSLELVESFNNYTINDIAEDHTGGVWIGLHKVGIRRYEENKKPFMLNQGFGNDHISSIFPVQDGNIWVGTEGSGLFQLDSINSESYEKNTLPYSKVYAIDYAECNNTLYVATGRSLNKIKMEEGKYSDPEVSLHNPSVRNILADSNYLWLALYNRGVLRQNLNDESYTGIMQRNGLPSNIVRCLMQDRDKNIWICTSNGIAKIPSEERFKTNPKIEKISPDSVGNHYAISIAEDRRGDIWYGTLGYGLYRLQKSSGGASDIKYRATHISTKDGLASNVIKAIVEDDNGVIWISTNRGISSLMIDKDQININNFGLQYGLQDYEFNELSAAKLNDGTLIFGGVEGYNYFNPNSFMVDTTQIRPVITDFRLQDHSILEDRELGIIAPGGLHGEEGVRLKYDQNNFTIKFAGLHFSNPSKYQYKYQLEGVDRTWIDSSDGVLEVSYTNLSPGDYTFYLRAANDDGVWARDTLALKIVIEPPFWAMWYAMLIYALLLALLGFLIIHYFHGLMERRNATKLADMEKRKMQEMLDMRTRFFTNISHEFRTPLTLILTPLQRLIADEQIASNPKWQSQLNTMAHNGNSLMRLINEFLSYTKHESGVLKAQLSHSEFTSLTQRLFEQFKFWAEQRNLTLHYKAPQGRIVINFDQYLIEQVIYNLASNAIKYTPEGGSITLAIEEYDDHIVFSIEDSGCGIAEDLQPHIFERFYSRMTDASKEVGGTGVGLFLTKCLVELHEGEIWFETEVGKGTTFFVKLPKGEAEDSGEESQIGASNTISPIGSMALDNEEAESTKKQTEGEVLPTLLIVDDNKEILQMLSELFEEYYTILTANDGVDGWGRASKHLPDIIISDVMMPRMNGLDLCDRIKGDATTSHIPVVLLSAKTSNEDVAAGMRSSADAYCPKPFNNDVLIETINSILVNRRKLADRFSTMPPEDSEASMFANYGDDATTNTDKLFLKRLTEYIEANVHNPELVVNDLCNYMGITPLVLNKKLKSLVNMTANALIRTIRLRRAAALLRTARYTIADVTYDVGFSDLRYFRECFKKEFGLLPQEFKDQSANGVEIDIKQGSTVANEIVDAVATKSIQTRIKSDKEEE
ncbi:MAG: two-component regulator propeller domain-containing protein [Rikenellaceae bacterium]